MTGKQTQTPIDDLYGLRSLMKKPKVIPRARKQPRNAHMITKEEGKETYKKLKEIHEKHLKKHGVKLPRIGSQGGLALTYLYINRGKKVTKKTLSYFVKYHGKRYHGREGGDTDMQAGRHLAVTQGWNVLSSTRGDKGMGKKSPASYKMGDPKIPYRDFKAHRDSDAKLTNKEWEKKKEEFTDEDGLHCASCGSVNGKPHLRRPNQITKIEKGHMDPSKPLTALNCVPQCQIFCNQVYKNKFTFDKDGRTRTLADGKVLLKSNDDVIVKAMSSVIENKGDLIRRLDEDVKKALRPLLEEE